MCHRSVVVICNEPVESLVSIESDLVPPGAGHIFAVAVEVAQEHYVLLDRDRVDYCV